MDNELLKQVTEKAEKWLSPEYDEETRAAVKAMLDSEDKTELIESFYKTSNSALVACAESWAPAQTV